MAADTTTNRPGGARGRPGRSRRGLLAGAAGALGALAAETIAPARTAAATPPPVLLGSDNIGATRRTGVFTTGNNEWGILADPGTSDLGSQGVYGVGQNTGVRGESATGAGVIGQSGITGGKPPVTGTGVVGIGAGTGYGVAGVGGMAPTGVPGGAGVHGTGGNNNGIGVAGLGVGTGPGVVGFGGDGNGTGVIGTAVGNAGVGVVGNGSGSGTGVIGRGGATGDGVAGNASTGNGIHGTAAAAAGVGVLAENTAGGTALKATGPAVFSRSGLLTVAAGKLSATQTGVTLTAASLVLATVQQNLSGVYVRSAVPNVASSLFTIYLSKAPSASAKVAWFIVN